VFTLTFTEPGGRAESHPLLDEERGIVVGRDAACEVVLQSKEVSRKHARFFVRAGDLMVEDLGSQNGVVVAGARIQQPTVLIGTPAIEIGDVKVAVGGAQPAVRKAEAKKKPDRRAEAPLPQADPGGRRVSEAASKGVGAGAVLRGKAGKQVVLPARAVVGRVADCDVVLDDDSVSRHHAELSRDDRGLYRLKDLESANGTFLNGKRLTAGESLLVPEGAKLRFGDVELHLWRPVEAKLPRKKLLLYALGALVALVLALLVFRRGSERTGDLERPPEEEATALVEQAQAAIEADRFEEAARLAQQAIDLDPLSPAPRKLLAQSRRDQQASRIFADASSKAQVGREDEALRMLAQVSPQSRYFARARIKAKDLAAALLRMRGQACRTAPRDNAAEVAEECARALDVKCQQGAVDEDPMLKALRTAEKRLPRRVAWSCPTALAPLFQDDAGGDAADSAGDKALAALYTDPAIRDAMQTYARGDVNSALKALAKLRGPSAAQSRELTERLKVVDGRFREGQTALISNQVERADAVWGEALAADAALMPAGTASFLGRQMRTTLAGAHGKIGDDRFAKEQYTSAYDEWTKGLAVNPSDPHLLDSLARLEKVAEDLAAGGCDQAQVAAHITRSDPPSSAHEAAQKALEGCR
jgi:pSer/pThr/pTyr-binding forkhead associated (FHA) protein